MILSEEKINHISHLVLNGLKTGIANLKDEEISVLRDIKRIVTTEMRLDDEVDAIVRKKLEPYARKFPEGTPDWNLQYNRFFDEEMRKRRR